MAIKVLGTTVIDNSRNIKNIPAANITDIYRDTSDGSDTGFVRINGGGAINWVRGAGASFYGNENATDPGLAWLYSGNVVGSETRISAGGSLALSIDGDTGAWSVAGAGNTGTSGQVLTSQGSGGAPGWSTISVDVLGDTAAASVGDVGTYAFLGRTTSSLMSPGDTVAGSSLRYVSAQSTSISSPTPSGTWRCMGYHNATAYAGTLFLRIS
jgi:hypothetical protein